MKELLSKITTLDEETLTISKAIAFLIRSVGFGLGAGLFIGVIFAVIKYTPLLIDKL